MSIFSAALIALFTPNPLHVDERLVYVAGTMEKMVTPDVYVINGEKVKIWGVAPNTMPKDETDQIAVIAAQFSAAQEADEGKEKKHKSGLARSEDAVTMRVASLKYTNLHCFRQKGGDHFEVPVMRCYTQNMRDFATCLLARGVVRPEAGIHKTSYAEIHKAAALGKSGRMQTCH